MDAIREIVERWLSGGEADLIIGWGTNHHGQPRPLFVRRPQEADQLMGADGCPINLSLYLLKPEVRKAGKIGIVADTKMLRAVVQLAAENQIKDGEIRIIAVDRDGAQEIASLAAVESFLQSQDHSFPPADQEVLRRLQEMSLEERGNFWRQHFRRCFKCYACRAACPLCYCSRCTVEMNQPQWIRVASHHLGNLEWHLMRAMHLAGRCVGCGACGQACPVAIPVHLLSFNLSEVMWKNFSSRAGMSVAGEHALAVFRPDDREDFIR